MDAAKKSINVLLVNAGFSFVSYPLLLTFKTYIMKKIFTLLFAVALFSAAQAQPGSRDNRDNRDNRHTDRRDDDDDRYDNERDVVVNHNPYDNNDDRYRNDDVCAERVVGGYWWYTKRIGID